jgi:23S rRNA (adenine2030-N6)-methyltransferase
MNYRHAFHAGNFADVVKHALLTLALMHLRKKPAPFRVIDTHAGAGRTNLGSSEAVRGGEWQGGIGRIWSEDLGPAIEPRLAPYREALRAFNPDGALKIYPGSPLLIRHFLRPEDRLIACELETGAAQALARNLRGDPRVKAIAIDGWTALGAYIPPKERRGLMLIDPPFEAPDELSRLAGAIGAAHAKWRSGMLLAWYPIKDAREVSGFLRALSAHGLENSLRIELVREGQPGDASHGDPSRGDPSRGDPSLGTPVRGAALRGTGMIAVHPPFTLAADAKILLSALGKAFWPDQRASVRVENLVG